MECEVVFVVYVRWEDDTEWTAVECTPEEMETLRALIGEDEGGVQ